MYLVHYQKLDKSKIYTSKLLQNAEQRENEIHPILILFFVIWKRK